MTPLTSGCDSLGRNKLRNSWYAFNPNNVSGNNTKRRTSMVVTKAPSADVS